MEHEKMPGFYTKQTKLSGTMEKIYVSYTIKLEKANRG